MTYEQAKQKLDELDKIPYPNLSSLTPNKQYGQLIYDDYAGEFGELSAITQYIYEHILLSKQEDDVSKILRSVAIVEMRHLDMLGNLLLQLGVSPIYVNSHQKEWNATNVKYDTGDLPSTMRYNIFTENKAIEGYQKAIRYTNNMSIKNFFKRIILDEKLHKEIFSSFLF